MSDVVTTARAARRSLSRALSALQSEDLPPHLLDLAEPIAKAMGMLHAIERSGGTALQGNADGAITSVRAALNQLQNEPPGQAAIEAAMEAVADSLGGVHALTKLAKAQVLPVVPVYGPPPASPYGPPPEVPRAPPLPYGPPPEVPRAQPLPYGPPPEVPRAPPPPPPPPKGPVDTGMFQPAAVPARSVSRPELSSAAPSIPEPRSDLPLVEAELGAHSTTNFFKGLAGNDVVDYGGIFVATYRLPRIGVSLRLHVTLPGGYEFVAIGVVRWAREPSEASLDSPPGFGAQFTEITPEARQLVHRYVRNREPLFHDDL